MSSPTCFPDQKEEFFFKPNNTNENSSIIIGNYLDRIPTSSTSYLIDCNYASLEIRPSKYRPLQELIAAWMNEPSDYDLKEWPKIEKELSEHRIKFRQDESL